MKTFQYRPYKFILLGVIIGLCIAFVIGKTTQVLFHSITDKYFSMEMQSVEKSYINLRDITENKHDELRERVRQQLKTSLLRLSSSSYTPSETELKVIRKARQLLFTTGIKLTDSEIKQLDNYITAWDKSSNSRE